MHLKAFCSFDFSSARVVFCAGGGHGLAGSMRPADCSTFAGLLRQLTRRFGRLELGDSTPGIGHCGSTDYTWNRRARRCTANPRFRPGCAQILRRAVAGNHLHRKFGTWVNPFASTRFQRSSRPLQVRRRRAYQHQGFGQLHPSYLTQTWAGYEWRKELQVRWAAPMRKPSAPSASAMRTTNHRGSRNLQMGTGRDLHARLQEDVMDNILFSTFLDVFANFKVGTRSTHAGRMPSPQGEQVDQRECRLRYAVRQGSVANRQIKENLAVAIPFFHLRPHAVLKEFKEFASRQRDRHGVGIIIGAAFGKIVSSFVGDLLTPPSGCSWAASISPACS